MFQTISPFWTKSGRFSFVVNMATQLPQQQSSTNGLVSEQGQRKKEKWEESLDTHQQRVPPVQSSRQNRGFSCCICSSVVAGHARAVLGLSFMVHQPKFVGEMKVGAEGGCRDSQPSYPGNCMRTGHCELFALTHVDILVTIPANQQYIVQLLRKASPGCSL